MCGWFAGEQKDAYQLENMREGGSLYKRENMRKSSALTSIQQAKDQTSVIFMVSMRGSS